MSQYNHNQSAEAYTPPPVPSTALTHVAPPPAGYPMKDDTAGNPQNHAPIETKTRGDGFWKGCFAALCCCCVLDACF